jgi:hypothetical protein
MVVPNGTELTDANSASSKLGFVYIFRTNLVGVYKLGFTESKLSARHRALAYRSGVSRIEVVVMVVDAREQELALFDVAWRYADRVQTNLARSRYKATELFVFDAEGLGAVRGYLLDQIAVHPYIHSPDSSSNRMAAVRKAIQFNRSTAETEMTLKGMDKILRSLKD